MSPEVVERARPAYTWSATVISAETDFAKRQALVYQAVSLLIDKYCLITPISENTKLIATTLKVHDTKLPELYLLWWPEGAWLAK